MKKAMWLILVVVLLALAGCQQTKPEEVVLAQVEAAKNGDLAAMQALYADDAVFTLAGLPFPDSVYSGRSEVDTFLAEQMGAHIQLQISVKAVDGEKVTTASRYATDFFKSVGIDWMDADEVYTVRDGKIVACVSTTTPASAEALVAALAAIEAQQAALTPEKLAGTWQVDAGPGVGLVEFQYLGDGTYEMVRYTAAGDPILWDAGTFSIEGDVVTLVSSDRAKYCEVGQSGSYQMTITESGQLQSVLVEDDCWDRRPPVEGPVVLDRAAN